MLYLLTLSNQVSWYHCAIFFPSLYYIYLLPYLLFLIFSVYSPYTVKSSICIMSFKLNYHAITNVIHISCYLPISCNLFNWYPAIYATFILECLLSLPNHILCLYLQLISNHVCSLRPHIFHICLPDISFKSLHITNDDILTNDF